VNPQHEAHERMCKSIGDMAKENKRLEARINHLETALRKIANQDYRGNRSTESQIAFEALKDPQ
jgi:hypothetical protein